MDVSLVIPAYNEDESLPELFAWVDRVCTGAGLSYEIIVIDDGSWDDTWQVIRKASTQYTTIQGIRFRRNYGKSAALNEAFACATGDVVITMDADMQDSPDEIPELRRMVMEEGYDLVSGWKQKRYDPIAKTVPSKLFNGVARLTTGIRLHDFNCGLKAYRKEVVKNVEIYGEMHRYIPVIAKWAGFPHIGEKVVEHRPRKYGVTKFGLERFVNGFLDLLSIQFVSRFGKRPMHFFGLLGSLSFFIGAIFALWTILDKVIKQTRGMEFRDATDNPLFYLALVAIIVGVQLFMAGFVSELVSRSSHDRNDYQVSERVGFSGELIADDKGKDALA